MDKIQKTKIWDLWNVNNRHRLGREVKVCRNTSDIFLVLFLFFFSLLPGFYQDTKPSWGIVQQAQAAKTSRISPSDRNARKRNTWSHRVGGSFQWFLFLTSLPWGQYQLLNCTATAEAEVGTRKRTSFLQSADYFCDCFFLSILLLLLLKAGPFTLNCGPVQVATTQRTLFSARGTKGLGSVGSSQTWNDTKDYFVWTDTNPRLSLKLQLCGTHPKKHSKDFAIGYII